MGVIRSVRIFKTIKELVFKILNTILIGCHRIDVVADSYITVSWKNKTRLEEGQQIGQLSIETKIIDSREFLNNSCTTTELVDQIFGWFKLIEQRCWIIYEKQIFIFQRKTFV